MRTVDRLGKVWVGVGEGETGQGSQEIRTASAVTSAHDISLLDTKAISIPDSMKTKGQPDRGPSVEEGVSK